MVKERRLFVLSPVLPAPVAAAESPPLPRAQATESGPAVNAVPAATYNYFVGEPSPQTDAPKQRRKRAPATRPVPTPQEGNFFDY